VENESSQSWTLIAIAALGLVLGVIALIVAFNAKSSSDDAASQASVEEVDTELSNLIDRLGIAEASLTGEQKAIKGTAEESRNETTNLSKRIDKLQRETAQLNATVEQTAGLTKQVARLESQMTSTNERVTALTKRVNNLSERVNSGG
jgi:predicted nuclease with TOPRIM domain